jgi:hypothetical protein
VCSAANGWINPIINNINVVSHAYQGTNADFITGGFASQTQNCLTLTHKANDYFTSVAGALSTFLFVLTNSTYFSVADWNHASGDTGITTNPNLGAAAGTNVVCYPGIGPSGIPIQPGTIACPSAYQMARGNALIGGGLDLTQTPYFLTLPTQDYFTNTVPNTGGGSGYNYGAYGGGGI